ncbi:MAG: hypothetical protein H3Z52_05920, partial [archaeon]|nr:hypothetical protein [archaeon]
MSEEKTPKTIMFPSITICHDDKDEGYEINSEGAKAKFENGFLKFKVPFKEKL